MVQLCSNREEGFSTSSPLASPFPTTCFFDCIIIPLPVWIYLLLLLLALALSRKAGAWSFNRSTAHRPTKHRRSIFHKILIGIYYFLIAANILMQTVEVVRLCLEYFGVGLLPFSYVGLVFGLVIHATNGLRGRIQGFMWKALNTLLWIGLMIVNLVKTAALVQMEKRGIYRTDTKYPMSDWVTDAAVMAGLYLFIAVLEIGLGVMGRGGRGIDEAEDMDVQGLRK